MRTMSAHDPTLQPVAHGTRGTGAGRTGGAVLGWLTGPVAAAALLAAGWLVMVGSVREKSLTADEAAHAAAGYSYWKFHDYRLNPENGNLPQRVMALPLLAGGYAFPSPGSDVWRTADAGAVGDVWFHELGNDFRAMLLKGRAAMALLTVALGALVWLWARRLFGPTGGMLSLVLFVSNPSVLANGPLMASDSACALFLLGSAFAVASLLRRLTAWRLLASAATVGGLFLTKQLAVLVIPIGLGLALMHVLRARPVWLGFGLDRNLTRRTHVALALIGATAAHVVLVAVMIWGFHGFRYSAFAPAHAEKAGFRVPWEMVLGRPSPLSHLETLGLSDGQKADANAVLERYDWTRQAGAAAKAVRDVVLTPEQARRFDALLALPAGGAPERMIEFFARHRLLPEAYLYGAAHAWRYSRMRTAYFNGEYGATGWRTFFPYTVLVKTPLPFFALCLLAAVALVVRRRAGSGEGSGGGRDAVAGTLPLWLLLAFLWAAVIPSSLNIGHRFVLATYPPLIVLCGAVGWWIEHGRPAGVSRFVASAGLGLTAACVAEAAYRYPNYIAYFNGLVSPREAYRHLVDSSLDWGQDLPGVKRYIDTHAETGPFYLSYFGAGRPSGYGINAQLLICGAGIDQPRAPFREVRAPVAELESYLARARQAWPSAQELSREKLPTGWVRVLFLQHPAVPRLGGGTYLVSATMLASILGSAEAPIGPWNERFERTYQELRRTIAPLLDDDAGRRAQAYAALPEERWIEAFEAYALYRFARLAAWLRRREPDDHVNYSILVYRLTDADVNEALDGPPPERGLDFPARLMAQFGDEGSPSAAKGSAR